MSFGQNHTYDAYQKASDAIKTALVEALNNDEDDTTLDQWWDCFKVSRSIADSASSQISFGDEVDFSLTTNSPIMADIDLTNVKIDTSNAPEVITTE